MAHYLKDINLQMLRKKSLIAIQTLNKAIFITLYTYEYIFLPFTSIDLLTTMPQHPLIR